MVDTTWTTRTSEDSPSITFCAMKDGSVTGWKNVTAPDLNTSAIDQYCDESTTIQEAVECFIDNTFNLTETIKHKESSFWKVVQPKNEHWVQDITETYIGEE